jgi:hypothetical protein
MKLRFVERRIHTTHYRILQQWWENPKTVAYTGDRRDLVPIGEWRDVPVKIEENENESA